MSEKDPYANKRKDSTVEGANRNEEGADKDVEGREESTQMPADEDRPDTTPTNMGEKNRQPNRPDNENNPNP
jgi:hypothetical protein